MACGRGWRAVERGAARDPQRCAKDSYFSSSARARSRRRRRSLRDGAPRLTDERGFVPLAWDAVPEWEKGGE